MTVLRALILVAMVAASLAGVSAWACPDEASQADAGGSVPAASCDNGTHTKAAVCPGGS